MSTHIQQGDSTNLTGLAMAGGKVTGLGAGTVAGDALRYEQLISLYLLLTGGTMGGAIAMGTNKITGLGAGTTNGDALRYEQLSSLYLLLAGGTMGGAIAMGTNKITGLGAATTNGDALRYEQLIGAYLALSGGTLTDNLVFNPTTKGVKGTTTNDSTAALNVGEVISASVLQSAPTSITTGTAKTIASISLTAGDWDVRVMAGFLGAAGTTSTEIRTAISLTTNTLPASDTMNVPTSNEAMVIQSGSVIGSGNATSLIIPSARVSLASTTTIYMVSFSNFSVSTMTGFGSIVARRMR